MVLSDYAKTPRSPPCIPLQSIMSQRARLRHVGVPGSPRALTPKGTANDVPRVIAGVNATRTLPQGWLANIHTMFPGDAVNQTATVMNSSHNPPSTKDDENAYDVPAEHCIPLSSYTDDLREHFKNSAGGTSGGATLAANAQSPTKAHINSTACDSQIHCYRLLPSVLLTTRLGEASKGNAETRATTLCRPGKRFIEFKVDFDISIHDRRSARRCQKGQPCQQCQMDDPSNTGVKHLAQLTTPTYCTSLLYRGDEKDIEKEINERLYLTHPELEEQHVELTTIRKLKRVFLKLCDSEDNEPEGEPQPKRTPWDRYRARRAYGTYYRHAMPYSSSAKPEKLSIDLTTVACAMHYLETLVMQLIVTKHNTEAVAVCCLMIAIKFNETGITASGSHVA